MNKGKSIGENAENCQGSKKPQKHFIEFSLCCLSFLILETEWHAKNFLQLSDEIDRISRILLIKSDADFRRFPQKQQIFPPFIDGKFICVFWNRHEP